MRIKTKVTIFSIIFLFFAVCFANSASAATNVYYSVGQSSANFMTGIPTGSDTGCRYDTRCRWRGHGSDTGCPADTRCQRCIYTVV